MVNYYLIQSELEKDAVNRLLEKQKKKKKEKDKCFTEKPSAIKTTPEILLNVIESKGKALRCAKLKREQLQRKVCSFAQVL